MAESGFEGFFAAPGFAVPLWKPYGKRLERLSIPVDNQQDADRTSAEGATRSWMTDRAVCVNLQLPLHGYLAFLTAVHRIPKRNCKTRRRGKAFKPAFRHAPVPYIYTISSAIRAVTPQSDLISPPSVPGKSRRKYPRRRKIQKQIEWFQGSPEARYRQWNLPLKPPGFPG